MNKFLSLMILTSTFNLFATDQVILSSKEISNVSATTLTALLFESKAHNFTVGDCILNGGKLRKEHIAFDIKNYDTYNSKNYRIVSYVGDNTIESIKVTQEFLNAIIKDQCNAN